MSGYMQAVRSFSPSLWRIFAALALVIAVTMGLQAVLLNLYLLRLGYDARYVGLLAGIGQLVWAVSALPAILINGRIGLRNSLQLSLALGGLGLVLVLCAESLPRQWWQTWLIAGQVVMNVGLAIGTVSMPPYIMAVTGERERPHAFSFVAALIPFAALVGSIVAGILPDLWGVRIGIGMDQPTPYRLALWLGPILCWLGILPLIGADPGYVHEEEGSGDQASAPMHGRTSRRAPLGLLVFWGIFVLIAAIGEGSVRTFFNVYMNNALAVPPATIGVIMGAAQILPILAALALPLALTRWGAGYTLGAGLLVMAAFLAPLATTPQLWIAAMAYMGAMASFTIVGAGRDLFGQEMVIPRWRTSSQAVAIFGLAMGNAVAAVLGGLLILAVGFGALYLFGMSAACVAAGLLFIYLYTRGRRQARYAAKGPEAAAG
jgi:predicted MFS family arabinose efflux permease